MGIKGQTAKGYIRVYSGEQERNVFAHRKIWEACFGPVPAGHCIHHLNGDKSDNRLENLQILTNLAHKRMHSNCELIGGRWYKTCRDCGRKKRIGHANWYYVRGTITGRVCRKCWIKIAVLAKRSIAARNSLTRYGRMLK